MKKSQLPLAICAVLALSLPACSRDTLSGGEQRASSPEAAEFNQRVSEGSRTPEEMRDSAAAKGGRRRANRAATTPQ